MTKSSIALGSVFALAALLILWIVTGDGFTSSQPEELWNVDPHPNTARAEALPDVGPPANGERALVDEQADASANGATQRPALTTGRPVRVISALNGEPLPGALVTWMDGTSDRRGTDPGVGRAMEDSLGDYLELGDPEQELRRRGETRAADEEGRLFLPPRDGLVMGRHGDLWLMCEIHEDPAQEFVLALEPDSTVVLRVLDARGVPVGGMEVFVCRRAGVWPEDMYYGRTDGETGEATFSHLGAQLRAMRAGLFGELDASSDVFFCAIVQAPEFVSLLLDTDNMPTGRVDLILPGTGDVTLRVVDSEGELVRDAWYKVYLFEAEVDELVFPGDYINALSDSKCVEGQGTVGFERIGLGMKFSMEVVLIGGGSSYESTFLGPRFDGEQVQVSIEVESPQPCVSLRVLDPEGVPLSKDAYLEFTVQLRRGQETHKHTQGLRVDSSGRIHLHGMDGNSFQVGDTCEFSLVQRHLRPMRAGRATTALPLARGVNDLGDVTVGAAAVIARGRVVDASGAPISGAHVAAREYTPPSAGVGLALGGKVSGTGTRTDSTGAFVLHGLPGGEQLSLRCSRSGFLVSRVDGVLVGAEDVVIRMDLAGYLAGSVLVSVGVPPERLELVVRATDSVPTAGDPHGRKLGRKTSPDKSGAFRSLALVPGEYTLVVFLRGVAEPLLQLDELHVAAGETTLDPRLDPIDLRSLHVFDLEITDRAGNPIPEGRVRARASGQTEEPFPSEWFTGGHFTVVVPYDAVDLKIEADRHRAAELSGVVSDTRVVMDPWPSVLLALDDSSVTFDDSLIVEFWMETPKGEGEYGSADWSDQLGENGEGLWYLDRPGPWLVHPQILCPEGYWGDFQPIEIEVADIPEEQRIEIHLAPEALEAALAECAEDEDD